MHFLCSVQTLHLHDGVANTTALSAPARERQREPTGASDSFTVGREELCEQRRLQPAAPGAGCKSSAVKRLSPPPEAWEAALILKVLSNLHNSVSELARCSVTCASPLTREEPRTPAEATLR